MEVFIDTFVIIDIHRGYGLALDWLKQISGTKLNITPPVWMEIIEGGMNKIQQNRLIKLLSQFDMVYPTEDDMDWAMRQFAVYRLSHNVDWSDCLIAAPAQRLQLPLYTRNIKYFSPLLNTLVQKPY
jgi:predicted nucleic acid-binding protein